MPHNEDMVAQPLLVQLKHGEKPTTKYLNAIDEIKVTLMNAPTMEELKNYIPAFTSGTWRDKPQFEFSEYEKEQVMNDLFDGYLLPTALETIKLTFLVEGLDMIEVPHLIRHRTLSFSAQGTGDRDLRHDDILVKPSILHSKHFEKYKKMVELSKELYADLTDDPDVGILDPRTVLPRCTKNYYYFSGDLKAIMAFVRQRKDESIEPEVMNLFAIQVWIEVVNIYPQLKNKIDLRSPDLFAIETSKGGRSSNFYEPEPKNDIYDYNINSFMRQKMRQEMNGGNDYIVMRDKLLAEFDLL